jgi:NADPH2:quinone reductase
MKAILVHQFGEPDVLKVETAPDPKPASGQILIRVRAAGVNPVETYVRAGKFGPREFPFTPGNDCAGMVEAVGQGVSDFRLGDRVFTDKTITGSYAELTLAEAKFAHRLPEKMTFQQGATTGTPGGTAYRGLFQRGRGIAGETVLIHGATGGVGTCAIQLARAAGMTVIATAGDGEGRKYVLGQGAHHAVDHKITQRPEELTALTGGKGPDLILEMSADKNLASDLDSIARGGRIVTIGSHGKIEIEPRLLMSKESEIIGLMLFGATDKEHRQMYSAIVAAMEAGTFHPVVGMELKLADAAKAHKEVVSSHSHGKIVLIP